MGCRVPPGRTAHRCEFPWSDLEMLARACGCLNVTMPGTMPGLRRPPPAGHGGCRASPGKRSPPGATEERWAERGALRRWTGRFDPSSHRLERKEKRRDESG